MSEDPWLQAHEVIERHRQRCLALSVEYNKLKLRSETLEERSKELQLQVSQEASAGGLRAPMSDQELDHIRDGRKVLRAQAVAATVRAGGGRELSADAAASHPGAARPSKEPSMMHNRLATGIADLAMAAKRKAAHIAKVAEQSGMHVPPEHVEDVTNREAWGGLHWSSPLSTQAVV